MAGKSYNVTAATVGSGVNLSLTNSGALGFSPAPAEVFAWNMATGQKVQYDVPLFAIKGALGPLSGETGAVFPINNNSADVRMDYSFGYIAEVSGSQTISVNSDGFSFPKSERPEYELNVGLGGHVSAVGLVAGASIGANSDQGIVISFSPLVGTITWAPLAPLFALEDPDGGFNGGGLVTPSYGSGRMPVDNDGLGIGIRPGDEHSALDQLAYETFKANGNHVVPYTPTQAHNTDKLNVAGPSAADMAPPKPDLAKDKPLDPGLILPPRGGQGSGAHLHKMFSGPAFKNQPIPAQVQPTPAQVAQNNREKKQKRVGRKISFWKDRFQISGAYRLNFKNQFAGSAVVAAFLGFSATNAAAQETECVTERQYLRGEFTADSTPCDEALRRPMQYCSPEPLSQDERAQFFLSGEDYAVYLAPDWPGSLEASIARTDLLRLSAASDDSISESASELFFLLFSFLLSAQINDLFKVEGEKLRRNLFFHKELQLKFFPFGPADSAKHITRMIDCAVLCGSEQIKPELLTRSTVFQMCLGESQ